VKAVVLVAGLLAAAAPVATQAPSLDDLLEKAGRYVRGFEQDFARIIGDETSVQREFLSRAVRGVTRSAESHRTVTSETLFQWVAPERAWVTVRSVLRVDGRGVPDSRARLDKLLAGTDPNDVLLFKRLRDESTRYNLGRIQRNFNDPMLPIQILDPDNQPRFRFVLEGTELLDGVAVWQVRFAERTAPSIVSVDNASMMSRGSVWLSGSGIVLRTRLDLANPETNLSASVIVTYAADRKVGGWLPARMDEHYSEAPRDANREDVITDQIVCQTTYSNYRRFETAARLIDPK
jgi:hypothetical protein